MTDPTNAIIVEWRGGVVGGLDTEVEVIWKVYEVIANCPGSQQLMTSPSPASISPRPAEFSPWPVSVSPSPASVSPRP